MQNTIRFSSELFNSTIPQDTGFGEDVGRWVKARLEEKGHSVSGPDYGDGCWSLGVKKGSSRSTIDISIYDGEDGVQWQLFLKVAVPLLTKIFGVPESEVSPELCQDLQQVLENEPDIRAIEWVEPVEESEEGEELKSAPV